MAPYDPRANAPYQPPPHMPPPHMPGPFMGAFRPPVGPPPLAFHPGMPLTTGTTLAQRFEILKRIGEGNNGFVYLCRDTQGGIDRIVKTFDPRRGDHKDEDLFRREARLLNKLNHEQIPKGYGLFDHMGMLCAPQDYIEGQDLADYVDRNGPMPEPEAVDVLRQVLQVLRTLHEGQPAILHRDLKPENLMRDRTGRIWVIDFGIATDAAQDKGHVPLEAITTNQTLGYASPEQVMGLESYPQSDLYALAATILFLLTGRNPIALYNGHAAQFEWPGPMSRELRRLLAAMLKIPAAERPESAALVLEQLAAGMV